MNISPFAKIKAYQEKKREERQAKIAVACQKVNLPLDEVDLTHTGLDSSRTALKGSLGMATGSVILNAVVTGLTGGVAAPLLALSLVNLGAVLGIKGNQGYKKVNAELLSRTDSEDNRSGAVKKYFATKQQALASVQAGLEKLERHLRETDEEYRARILKDRHKISIGRLCGMEFGRHFNESTRLLKQLPNHGDGRVYSIPFYIGGKSTLTIKTTSREKALELREKANAVNNPEPNHPDSPLPALRQPLLG